MKKKVLSIIALGITAMMFCNACSGGTPGKESTVPVSTENTGATDTKESSSAEKAEETEFAQPVLKSSTEAIKQVAVQLDAGTLMGYEQSGIYHFKGIPYATADRFKGPVPVTKFDNEVQMALTYGAVAPQDRSLNGTGEVNSHEFMTPSNGTADMVANENCQNLNVWSSDLKAAKPVVVFFHGGGLNNGASSELSYYTGEYFVESEDTVFVSVNHRLNVLGYLDLSEYGGEDYANSGISGIDDCVCALEWVQNNIAQFGGDPSNVTIIGQSGGGTKVTTLACMSNTVDLFDKIVVMSGNYSTSSKQEGIENTKLLVDYLGLADDEVIDALSNMSYEDLFNAATEAGCSWTTHYGDGTFTNPLFDSETGMVNEYAAQRTWVWGSTFSEFNSNGEGLITGKTGLMYLPKTTDDMAMEALKETYGENAQEVADAFKMAYPDHALAEALYLSQGSSAISRYGIISPRDGILKKFNDSGIPVYNYMVTYKEPYFGGVTMHHTGDVAYWFNSLDTIPYQVQGDEENAYAVALQMSRALKNFIKNGNPSTDSLSWKPYTTDEHNTMVFDVKSELKTDYDTDLYETIMKSQN